MQEKEEEKLNAAILKVALGYQVAEVVEEFAEVDGELKLTKRKRTKKDVPPDLKAVQLLLSGNTETGLEALSDEELQAEKERLLMALAQAEASKKTGGLGKAEGQVCVETTEKPLLQEKTGEGALAKSKAKAKGVATEVKGAAKSSAKGALKGATKKKTTPSKGAVKKKKSEV